MTSAVSERVVSALMVGPPVDLESLIPREVRAEIDNADGPDRALVRLAGKRYDIVLINHTAEGEVTAEQLGYLRALRTVRPDCKCILLVSHSTTRKVVEALRHG